MDLTKETNDGLLGMYQIFHNDSAMAIAVRKELIARGYEPKCKPYYYADGSRGYEPIVFKDGVQVL